MLPTDLKIGVRSASLSSLANLPFLIQSLKISVKIGAHVSTFSCHRSTYPSSRFWGSNFFISDVTSSKSTKWNSKLLSKFFPLMAIMLVVFETVNDILQGVKGE